MYSVDSSVDESTENTSFYVEEEQLSRNMKIAIYCISTISFWSICLDIIHLAKAPFSSAGNYVGLMVVLGLRFGAIVIYSGYILVKKVFLDKSTSENLSIEQQKKLKTQGCGLYSSMCMLIFTGFYRMLPHQHFKQEIKFGYMFEIFFQLIPMFLIQIINSGQSNWIESFIFIWKPIQLIVILGELSLMAKKKELNLTSKKTSEEQEPLVEVEGEAPTAAMEI